MRLLPESLSAPRPRPFAALLGRLAVLIVLAAWARRRWPRRW